MDNQQERTSDLKWLAGIIDGEGSVTALIGHTMTSKGHIAKNRRYTPLISVVNTDKKIVDEVTRILTAVELPYYIYSREDKKHPTWKTKWEIMINGMKRCYRAIELLLPHLRSEKQVRMQALKEWIERRGAVDPKSPYTEEDAKLLSVIRQSPVILRD